MKKGHVYASIIIVFYLSILVWMSFFKFKIPQFLPELFGITITSRIIHFVLHFTLSGILATITSKIASHKEGDALLWWSFGLWGNIISLLMAIFSSRETIKKGPFISIYTTALYRDVRWRFYLTVDGFSVEEKAN
ncbi:hypothetical protein [Candidatus Uabimicrobium sp. HlEnr_7]|uniref:hypothetical protein n=1 Tax=Candidatus Uabimicrobium helgolandensis TaxID=3095367 RepID=UPI0035563D2E